MTVDRDYPALIPEFVGRKQFSPQLSLQFSTLGIVALGCPAEQSPAILIRRNCRGLASQRPLQRGFSFEFQRGRKSPELPQNLFGVLGRSKLDFGICGISRIGSA